jgi:NTE family protein
VIAAAAAATTAAVHAASAATPASRGRRLGFALGSGAMHGWAHVGIVRGCARAGFAPHAVAGSSVGAAVGALWAGGLDATRIATIARGLDWSAAGQWTWSARGLRRNDPLREAIDAALDGRPIEALPTRFAAVASDAASGDSVVLDRGPTGTAVAASSAVPVFFEPVRVGGRDLLDGSLTAPVPVDAARALGADVVVAVDIAFRPHEQQAQGLADLAFQAMHILGNALAREQTRRADLTIRLDLHHLMTPRLEPAALVDAGERALLDAAPRLRLLLA